MIIQIAFFFSLCSPALIIAQDFDSSISSIDSLPLEECANQIGKELWHLGEVITRKSEIKNGYSEADVEKIDGDALIEKMSNMMTNMIRRRIIALRRIVETAEQLNSKFSKIPPYNETFIDAKNLSATEKKLLQPNPGFYNSPVNTNFSSVHVPANVFAESNETKREISWSRDLDAVFIHNYVLDSTLSWQYFGSFTGFTRMFPGNEWQSEIEGTDMYDCRMRGWYFNAAVSPKDVVIVVDNSGSMAGIKREIARHTVNTILETIGPEDFVNVYSYNETIEPVVSCYRDDLLIQGNLNTIRELKIGVERMPHASQIGNHTLALTKAFQVLKKQRILKLTSSCNQAIMLITDGSSQDCKEVFEKYNWHNDTDTVAFATRVFTFLIGKEVGESRTVKWMACANRGYSVALNTMPEVREQVLQYLRVMSRPLVLYDAHPTSWTSIYADTKSSKLTDYLWEEIQKGDQVENSRQFLFNRAKFLSIPEQINRFYRRQSRNLDQNAISQPYDLMTTVSLVIHDLRRNVNITRDVLINEAYWVRKVFETRVANALGVAATDIPVEAFRRIMSPFKLGVNNYGFVVNNNGFIILHPDFRPVFRGILKPGYNSVDMAEVELIDDNRAPRNFSKEALELRDKVINREAFTPQVSPLKVKYHYDEMRRVSVGYRNYHIREVIDSPFTAVLTTMKNFKYRVVPPYVPINRKGHDVKSYFDGNWKIHPSWFYCRYNYKNEYTFGTPEEELLHFLGKTQFPDWTWPKDLYLKDVGKYTDFNYSTRLFMTEELSYLCDKELVEAIVYDANVTQFLAADTYKSKGADLNDERSTLENKFQVKTIFVSTHSGLTRWINLPRKLEEEEKDHTSESSFGDTHGKSIDELWYKRAAEQNYASPDRFLFSVPMQVGAENDVLVESSHAIYLENKSSGKKAPVAVVGYTFRHSALKQLLNNITESVLCPDSNCDSVVQEYDFYIIDNNGYVMVAPDPEMTGKFFGVPQPDVMRDLVRRKIYKKVTVYDYQGVCFHGFYPHPAIPEAAAMTGSAPLTAMQQQLQMFARWFFATIVWGFVQFNVMFLSILYAQATQFNYAGTDKPDIVNFTGEDVMNLPFKRLKPALIIHRTKPLTCDRKVDLFFIDLEDENLLHRIQAKTDKVIQRYYKIRPIAHTNLMLVAVSLTTEFDKFMFDTIPKEVFYQEYSETGLPSPACHKVEYNWFPRRRSAFCFNQHPEEINITMCGRGNHLDFNWLLSVILLLHRLNIPITA